MDLVSIIVPVYNVKEYLPKCLDTIINQTYKNIEIILVDDGSTDDSGSICDEYAGKDERIKVIHKDNGGVSTARNCGLRVAQGKYIGFIDSDDTVDKEYIEVLVNSYSKGNIELSLCNIRDIYPDRISEKREVTTQLSGKFYDDYHKLINLLRVPVVKLYRADVLKEYALFFREDVNSAEDQIFNFQYYRFVKLYYYNDIALYNYHHRFNNSLSQIRTIKAYKNNLEKLRLEKLFLEENQIVNGNVVLANHAIDIIGEFAFLDNVTDYKSFKNILKEALIYIDLDSNMPSFKRKVYLWLLDKKFYRAIYWYLIIKHLLKSLDKRKHKCPLSN